MLVSMGVINPLAPNTIAKYIPSARKPPSEKQIQSWRTFLQNHSKEIWAIDYLIVPTIKFNLLYVLIIINHGTRKIEHFAITKSPNLEWLKQKLETQRHSTINQSILFMTIILYLKAMCFNPF